MVFQSRPEAYTYAIWLLSKFAERYPDLKTIPACINRVRMAFENHEQEVAEVCNFIQATNWSLNVEDTLLLHNLITNMKASDFKQTIEQRFENPLARRAESELAIQLLLHPTLKMMTAVNSVSVEILKIIEDLEEGNNVVLLNKFLTTLARNYSVIACGAFGNTPNLTKIKTILRDNSPSALVKIMHIQYKFSENIFKNVPIKRGQVREPVGKAAEILLDFWSPPLANFFRDAISQPEGNFYRSYIADEAIYKSDLYTAERNRGRAGEFLFIKANQLGLMLDNDSGLPSLPVAWCPDCLSQKLNPKSAYVLDLLNNDAIYVAGPSGMASLLLGQMEVLANFESIELKQQYLSAVVGYIVGGGFHSLHEVIGPAEYALGLVPGYKVTAPKQGKLAFATELPGVFRPTSCYRSWIQVAI
jgi:hypothetical protein